MVSICLSFYKCNKRSNVYDMKTRSLKYKNKLLIEVPEKIYISSIVVNQKCQFDVMFEFLYIDICVDFGL